MNQKKAPQKEKALQKDKKQKVFSYSIFSFSQYIFIYPQPDFYPHYSQLQKDSGGKTGKRHFKHHRKNYEGGFFCPGSKKNWLSLQQ